jgi:hypothetical protein
MPVKFGSTLAHSLRDGWHHNVAAVPRIARNSELPGGILRAGGAHQGQKATKQELHRASLTSVRFDSAIFVM